MRLLIRVFDNKPCYLDLQADTVILVSSRYRSRRARTAKVVARRAQPVAGHGRDL